MDPHTTRKDDREPMGSLDWGWDRGGTSDGLQCYAEKGPS